MGRTFGSSSLAGAPGRRSGRSSGTAAGTTSRPRRLARSGPATRPPIDTTCRRPVGTATLNVATRRLSGSAASLAVSTTAGPATRGGRFRTSGGAARTAVSSVGPAASGAPGARRASSTCATYTGRARPARSTVTCRSSPAAPLASGGS